MTDDELRRLRDAVTDALADYFPDARKQMIDDRWRRVKDTTAALNAALEQRDKDRGAIEAHGADLCTCVKSIAETSGAKPYSAACPIHGRHARPAPPKETVEVEATEENTDLDTALRLIRELRERNRKRMERVLGMIEEYASVCGADSVLRNSLVPAELLRIREALRDGV